MAVSLKTVLIATAIDLALFFLALPLGDAHHGIGKQHPLAADLGNTVWAAFLIGAVTVVLLAAAALVQRTTRARRSRA